MKCEFDYCIYNRNSKCILRDVQINFLGICKECIVVTLDNNFLEAEKEKQLMELESQWADSSKGK